MCSTAVCLKSLHFSAHLNTCSPQLIYRTPAGACLQTQILYILYVSVHYQAVCLLFTKSSQELASCDQVSTFSAMIYS